MGTGWRSWASFTSAWLGPMVEPGEQAPHAISRPAQVTLLRAMVDPPRFGSTEPRLMQHIGPLNGVPQPTCPINASTGMIECNWAAAFTLNTGVSWTSGIYVAVLKNEANFNKEVLESQQPVLVDFWAEWCGPCKMLAPVLDDIATEKAGQIKVAKVNVDQNPELGARYGIQSIPTLLYFVGGELRDQSVGATSKRALLTHFGSAKGVAGAGLADLEGVDGVSKTVAKLVYDHFHPER